MSQHLHPYVHPKLVAKIRDFAAGQINGTAHGSHDKMFTQKWQDIKAQGEHLTAFASELTGKTVKGHEDALAALFTPEALAYIELKCLNTYWFWYLISKVNTRNLKFNEAAIARAHARVKDSINDTRYGFNFIEPSPLEHQLKGLPPGFVFEMWHKGRLLAEYRPSGDYKTLLNPLLIED